MSAPQTSNELEAVAEALRSTSFFQPWTDPVSGVTSFILSRRIAPIQQSFYFVNSGFTDNGRFLWIYCAFPPGGDAYYGRQLAVVDFAEQTVRHFPETQFADASPFVDPQTGEVYWTSGLGIWKRSPSPKAEVERVGLFPAELARNRRPLRLATHLSRSADRRAFAIDAQIGNEWLVGELAADGSEKFQLWEKFSQCYNHAQFSPTDPNLMLIAQDGWIDPSTGKEGETQDRLWQLRPGHSPQALLPQIPAPSSLRGHEWWDAEGRSVWYIDYRHGTAKVDLFTGERSLVWRNGHTHSHADRSGHCLVGDINPKGDDWRIAFYNVKSGKEINLVSQLPVLPYPRRTYHVHPHPRFCLGDRYICYTTNVLGTVDVALVPVDQLIERTT